jgi:2-C-methyl-D-erythritol 2,4-cyclodiphosphate synthase
MRIGLGYDIHAFEDNKPLKLGGVTIPHPQGLKGHSDGDCLIHAICDAILGAAGLGDIGEHFPDTDEKNKNIDSRIILEDILKKIKNKGFRIENIDVNIIAQVPKLTPFKNDIKLKLAEIMAIAPSQINIKAKTKEHLDAVGQKLAIECQAIVQLIK